MLASLLFAMTMMISFSHLWTVTVDVTVPEQFADAVRVKFNTFKFQTRKNFS